MEDSPSTPSINPLPNAPEPDARRGSKPDDQLVVSSDRVVADPVPTTDIGGPLFIWRQRRANKLAELQLFRTKSAYLPRTNLRRSVNEDICPDGRFRIDAESHAAWGLVHDLAFADLATDRNGDILSLARFITFVLSLVVYLC